MFRKKISLFVLPFMAIVSLHANDPFFDDPFGDDIFKEMYQMQQEMDKIFERMQERMDQRTKLWNYPTRQTFIPDNRIKTQSLLADKGTHYEYDTQIPEGPDNQIDISIHNGILHFKATVDTVKKTQNPNGQMQQHYVSMIQRSEALPADADPKSLKSEYRNGLLVLTFDKMKNIVQPVKREETNEKPADKPVPAEVQEKIDNNTTTIKVPHTSSQV